uniref:Lipase_3 domain-containing protein n=1 Tax=Caenorhabditis japonica TaxID=281687 RepID=A0A8R1HZU3_CAEJA
MKTYSLLAFLLSTQLIWVSAVFTSEDAQYNETEARMLLNLAAGAYASDATACVQRTFSSNENQMIISQFSVKCDFFGNPCAGYIIVSEVLQQITVVFRGTKTNSQLLLEGWTTLKPSADFYGIGLVNTYFKKGHEKTWDYVASALNHTNYLNYDVYVTGHSLGGALAALAAPRIVHEGLRQSQQVKIITFGEPRVGNLDFSHGYDQLVPYSFRVTHAIDVVPHLPACVKDLSYTPPAGSDGSKPCDPTSTNGGYHHAMEIWYPGNMTQGSQYMVCTGLPRDEDFSCSDAPKVDLNDTTLGVWDHRNYFGVEVPDFGKGGCDPSMTFAGPPTKTGIGALVSSVLGKRK